MRSALVLLATLWLAGCVCTEFSDQAPGEEQFSIPEKIKDSPPAAEIFVDIWRGWPETGHPDQP